MRTPKLTRLLCCSTVVVLAAPGPATAVQGENARTSSIAGLADFPYESRFVEVLGSRMHYIEAGNADGGPVVVMIHGQPTWSYLWRNVIPDIAPAGRVVAVDLIGFGLSDKPDIAYRVEDHARYLDAFMEALDLDDVILVVHDWGSFLGFDWAAHHPSKIRAIAFMEAILPGDGPLAPDDPRRERRQRFGEILQQIATPGVGERMILEENFFIEEMIPAGVVRALSDHEMDAYRLPFPEGSNRMPMLQFPREIPFLSEDPAFVIERQKNYERFLRQAEIPTLLLTFTPGALIGEPEIRWARENLKDLTVVPIGEGIHWVQEDHPDAIGSAIARWIEDNGL